MKFISISDVIAAALDSEIINLEESEELESYLTVLDQSVDQKDDKGFYEGQIYTNYNVNFSHKFSQDETRARSIHRLIFQKTRTVKQVRRNVNRSYPSQITPILLPSHWINPPKP